MLRKIHHHYTRSLQVHRLIHVSMTAPKIQDKLSALHQIKQVQSDHDRAALPRWVERSIEWYVGNAVPTLAPYGNHRPNFLRRLALALRSGGGS